jgi:hypothetical protein
MPVNSAQYADPDHHIPVYKAGLDLQSKRAK